MAPSFLEIRGLVATETNSRGDRTPETYWKRLDSSSSPRFNLAISLVILFAFLESECILSFTCIFRVLSFPEKVLNVVSIVPIAVTAISKSLCFLPAAWIHGAVHSDFQMWLLKRQERHFFSKHEEIFFNLVCFLLFSDVCCLYVYAPRVCLVTWWV